jgi:hypothetical protein
MHNNQLLKDAGWKDWLFNLFKGAPKGPMKMPPIGYPYNFIGGPGQAAEAAGTGLAPFKGQVANAAEKSLLQKLKPYMPYAGGAAGAGAAGGAYMALRGGKPEAAPPPPAPGLLDSLSFDGAGRNALIGAGIGLGGGALMGALSPEKKKNKLKSLLESALMGGMSGAAIGGLGTPGINALSKAGAAKVAYKGSVDRLLKLVSK